MNFNNITNITIPEGEVFSIAVGGNVLWTKPSSVPGYRLLYLQNGNDSSSNKQLGWSIDTGITWRRVFTASGLTSPGLETVVTYSYTNVPPEGGVFAGCNPRYNTDSGYGNRDQGGFWRIFGHGGANFCFDCPSEDDRNQISGTMSANTIYTETCEYGYLRGNSLESYLKLESGGNVLGENYKTSFKYSWSDAALPHNLYLWADLSRTTYPQSSGDTGPRGGVRIYGFEVWALEGGVRAQKLYEGIPWMDENNVPCIRDTVSGQFQYNCASGGAAFLYGTI